MESALSVNSVGHRESNIFVLWVEKGGSKSSLGFNLFTFPSIYPFISYLSFSHSNTDFKRYILIIFAEFPFIVFKPRLGFNFIVGLMI